MYLDRFTETFVGYARWLGSELTHPHVGNWVLWLLGLSVAVYAWELLLPWRRNQPRIRKDFWLDAFYMAFNVFLFNLIGYAAVSDVVVHGFQDLLRSWFGVENLVAIRVGALPVVAQLAILFVVRDFVQWNVHRVLHRVPILWEFHKVHHSVEQMGFAAHLRFHWMETIVYRTLEYLPLALIGFGIDDFLAVHLIALAIGHLNHANIRLPIGPLRYLVNSPQMHIWHHARDLPADRPVGVNFGLSLSIWDWLFRTAYWPRDGRDIRLGFDDLERFPSTFVGQALYPALRRRPAVEPGPGNG